MNDVSRVRTCIPWGACLLLLPLLVSAAPDDVANPDPERFRQEIDRFVEWDRRNAWPTDGVLFVGSSSIRMWPTRDAFPDLPVINRGFGGSHISDVLHFLEQTVLRYTPRVIVFYAGDNDVADGKPAEQVAADFGEFLARVRVKLPQVHVIYVPIKPSIARWDKWPAMSATNERIRARAREDAALDYADIVTPMLKDAEGPPPKSIFLDDGLHLSEAGYAMWNRVVRPLIDAARDGK